MSDEGFRSYVLIVGTVFAVALLVLAYFTLRRRHRLPFRTIPNYYPGATLYSEVPTVTAKEVVAALQAAETYLIEKTPYTAANMALVGHYVHVHVVASERWHDLWVANSDASTATIIVGPSLSGLAHELAHLAEQVLDRSADPNHTLWAEGGVPAALDAYADWLAKKRQADNVASGASGVISLKAVMDRQRYGEPLHGMMACRHRRPA